jgi:pyrimidine precursor biosynthesis enzyme
LEESFEPNYTNEFLSWELEEDQADPTGDQKLMVKLQEEVAEKGGFKRLDGGRCGPCGCAVPAAA